MRFRACFWPRPSPLASPEGRCQLPRRMLEGPFAPRDPWSAIGMLRKITSMQSGISWRLEGLSSAKRSSTTPAQSQRRLSKVKARRIIPKKKEKVGMQFLLLIYENEKRFVSGFDPAEMQEYETFGQQHANAIKGGNALQPTTEAQTVRVRNGKALTTDGPFAETKEQLGGYYLVDVPDKAAAAAIAAKIPGARFGCVEVRPIMTFS